MSNWNRDKITVTMTRAEWETLMSGYPPPAMTWGSPAAARWDSARRKIKAQLRKRVA